MIFVRVVRFEKIVAPGNEIGYECREIIAELRLFPQQSLQIQTEALGSIPSMEPIATSGSLRLLGKKIPSRAGRLKRALAKKRKPLRLMVSGEPGMRGSRRRVSLRCKAMLPSVQTPVGIGSSFPHLRGIHRRRISGERGGSGRMPQNEVNN